MGPRRVGKTILIYQVIEQLILNGVRPRNIMYVSIDSPIYMNLDLEQLLILFFEHNGLSPDEKSYVFFDEVQYLEDWERHLKSLVDTYKNVQFVASGSAAAALKMKSLESGAGRFTDFMLPPLMFSEYLSFLGLEDQFQIDAPDYKEGYVPWDMEGLNKHFLEYINYGGYPELVMKQGRLTQGDVEQFVQRDIIDKVLLRDLPSLYGIQNIRDLNKLFTMVAFNSGNEINISQLGQKLEIDYNTVKKYLEYLEAAFLIVCVRRIDQTAKHLQREHTLKVYLTNPSMHAALFSPVKEDDPKMGMMAETAIFSQWFHDGRMRNIRYARWRSGEVDLVHLDPKTQKPNWVYEIKWSDKYFDFPERLTGLVSFCKENKVAHIGATTKTRFGIKTLQNDLIIKFFPCSLHCYNLGQKMLS